MGILRLSFSNSLLPISHGMGTHWLHFDEELQCSVVYILTNHKQKGSNIVPMMSSTLMIRRTPPKLNNHSLNVQSAHVEKDTRGKSSATHTDPYTTNECATGNDVIARFAPVMRSTDVIKLLG